MTSDPAEAALITAVCADPPADEPRLAYATWVAQHAGAEGAARAEYIERTIRAYRKDNELEDYTSVEILTPERKAAWSNGVDKLGLGVFHFVRGFPASALGKASTLIRVGDELVTRCPLQYVSVFREAKEHLAELLRAPWMTHVFALDLAGNDLSDDDVDLIAHSKLSGLRWVNIEGKSLTMRAADVMADATVNGRFPELHTLSLPLDIYDDVEGDYGANAFPVTVFRPENAKQLRAKYGELSWLRTRPAGLRGQFHS